MTLPEWLPGRLWCNVAMTGTVCGVLASSHLVLIAGLEPVVALGLHRALLESGVDARIERGSPSEVAAVAGRLQPFAVVLGLEPQGARPLRTRIRREAPDAKVVLLARDEDDLEILDPGAVEPRRIREAVFHRLASELRHPSIPPLRSSACPIT